MDFEASDRDAPRRLGKRPPSLRHGQNKKCTWYQAMSSEMQDEPFYRDAFYRSPSRLEEALSAPLPPSPPGQYSLLRPQLNDGTVDWPQVPLDQLVDVAITGPLALVACDDDVETVSGDVDVDFADP